MVNNLALFAPCVAYCGAVAALCLHNNMTLTRKVTNDVQRRIHKKLQLFNAVLVPLSVP
jgi:hypothetical protein